MTKTWVDYYRKVAGRLPDPVLKIAVKKVSGKIRAYDLGCGTGDDTKYLLKLGANVIAVDKEESSIAFIKESLKTHKNLILEQNSFESMELDPCNFIWGRASFPFCRPEHFYDFWERMKNSLSSRGILSGTLFGKNDSWANNSDMTFISHGEWEKLLVDFDILYFDEQEYDLPTALGESKHWHAYFFVLKKL